ncbi:membrane protein required for beta-lactamase induction [Fluviicoccus keumensis]|uniref:Membrane protein required for beta-lactamase induction n=1 Tax=Fluviicoccus keumensis TaxID=1435465 RepID=A0A4Q7YJG6_9GAMM|nr:regulatory signaling modulator protein AmpE [Fluviicoccus keumensis]RZU36984.1 membrane protein required for beta-lactamase induction [Fluviicoccus keumensis]
MKVLLVLFLMLLVLAGRDLVSPAVKKTVSRPIRQLMDLVLDAGLKARQPGSLLFLLVTIAPVLAASLLLSAFSGGGAAVFWQFALILAITLPVFMDRRLPSVMEFCRKQWLDSDHQEQMAQRVEQAKADLLLTALQELFSPLFWLIVAGPAASLFYYLVRCCDEQSRHPEAADFARKVRFWLDWLPSRALAISFALAGDFLSVWKYLQLSFTESRSSIQAFITEAGQLAENGLANQALETPIDMVRHLAHYDSLCQRALGLWLVVMFLHALLP